VKTTNYLQLSPAAYRPKSVLLRRTSPSDLQRINQFTDRCRIKLSAGEENFLLRWDMYESERSTWPYRRPAIVVQAMHDYRTCGYSCFEIRPFSEEIPQEIAEMTTTGSVTPRFQNPYPTLTPTRHTLRTARAYREYFRGIGTTLLALSLHLAARRGISYFTVQNDISDAFHTAEESFYTHNGFRWGTEVNLALLGEGIRRIVDHARDEKVFYLNGLLDGNIDFEIPAIGIESRTH
jgi:hypothetical protein